MPNRPTEFCVARPPLRLRDTISTTLNILLFFLNVIPLNIRPLFFPLFFSDSFHFFLSQTAPTTKINVAFRGSLILHNLVKKSVSFRRHLPSSLSPTLYIRLACTPIYVMMKWEKWTVTTLRFNNIAKDLYIFFSFWYSPLAPFRPVVCE